MSQTCIQMYESSAKFTTALRPGAKSSRIVERDGMGKHWTQKQNSLLTDYAFPVPALGCATNLGWVLEKGSRPFWSHTSHTQTWVSVCQGSLSTDAQCLIRSSSAQEHRNTPCLRDSFSYNWWPAMLSPTPTLRTLNTAEYWILVQTAEVRLSDHLQNMTTSTTRGTCLSLGKYF